MGLLDILPSKWVIEAACLVYSDKGVLLKAQEVRMIRDGQAWKHLDHFLGNTGSDVEVAFQKVVDNDPGVRYRILTKAVEELRGAKELRMSKGIVDIQQVHYSVQDWRLALGAINVTWSVERVTGEYLYLRVLFADVYDWHPEEGKRPTQCVHQAAADLIDEGEAKTFKMYGSALIKMNLYTTRIRQPNKK